MIASLQALTSAQARQLGAAMGLLQAGSIDDALAIARRLAADATRAPDAQQLLAMCLAEAGHADESERTFQRALELAPNSPLILVNFATLLRKLDRPQEALAVFKRAVAAAPDFAKAWIELGMTATEVGQHQQALVALSRAVALQPDSSQAWHALGNLQRADGDLAAAMASFQTTIKLAPGARSAWVNLGTVLRLLGRPHEAVACLVQAESAGNQGPELTDVLAGALLDDGKVGDALALARRLTHDHPDFVTGHVTLAHMLWEYGPALAASESPVSSFRAAVQSQPNNSVLRMAFVSFLLAARMAEDALEQIGILQALDPNPVLTALQADALEILGRTEQAGALYEKAHRALGSLEPAFLNTYARHLLRAGKWDMAADRALEATRMDPANQESWAYLGTAWRLLDDPREYWLCDYERLVALVDVEPPAEFSDRSGFLDALNATLAPMHQARREPVQQTLRGGSQTPGRLFGRPDPVIAATQTSLQLAVERWLATLPTNPDHPFLMRNRRSVRIGGSWSVKLWSAGRHVNHIHPEGWMSSAFYVSLPPSVGLPTQAGHAGCIQFGQPPVELGLDLPPRRVIRPEAGKLALFPSYLWHGTVPFEDEQPRVTIAFDMTARDG